MIYQLLSKTVYIILLSNAQLSASDITGFFALSKSSKSAYNATLDTLLAVFDFFLDAFVFGQSPIFKTAENAQFAQTAKNTQTAQN